MADASKMAEYKEAIEKMKEAAQLEINRTEPVKNIEDLSLDDITEDALIEQFFDMGEELGVDTRQGSIYWDACMGSIIRTAMFFDQLASVKEIISLQTCTGDILDEKLEERGLTRNPAEATPATYKVIFVGEVPEMDSVMSCDDYLFTLQDKDGEYIIVSEDTGTELNDLIPGTEVIPEIDVDGLVSATLGELLIPAIDVEDDDSARERLINKISGPDENGNKSQIRTWCESVEGVGAARIIPLWNGPNTVAGIIVGKNGMFPSESTVSAVQDYLDPGGTGMGEGVASLGQVFTAIAAEELAINVSVSVLKKEDATYSEIQEDFRKLLTDYFRKLALEDYSSGMMARYVRIGAILEGMDAVIDYDNLTLNRKSANIAFTILQIPVLGEVVVDGNIQ